MKQPPVLLEIYQSTDAQAKCRALIATTPESYQLALGNALPAPGFPPLQWSNPKDLPKRKLDSTAGKIAFYHALAHIEFTAVNLALDALLRFAHLPENFYRDWWQVANEEAEHFLLLAAYLDDFGSYYGDLPVHAGLWEMAERTKDDPLLRMALVPRVLEARGLDVTPGMIQRLKAVGDLRGVEILEKIYQEEIGHVAIGSFWFQELANAQGFDPEKHFIALIENHLPRMKQGPFNHSGRLAAGFSEGELQGLIERNLAQA